MKEVRAVAKRYAKALCGSIKDKKDYEIIKSNFHAFLSLQDSVELFKNGMETQLFSENQKRELLDIINKKAGFDKRFINLLELLIERNRLPLLKDIESFLELSWNERNGIERIKVSSVIPLSDTQKKRLSDILSQRFSKKIILEEEIDKSLIAGIKLVRGTVNYDFSLSANLQKLKKSFIEEI